MATLDGATVEQYNLASSAGVTREVAYTKTGADLAYAKAVRENGGTASDGAAMAQAGASRPEIYALGEPEYAAAGGKATRVIGRGFTGATGVNFGATAGTSFSVVSDEVIAVTTPAKVAATYDVTVLHPSGNSVLTGGAVFA